jgi:hypothetical protein
LTISYPLSLPTSPAFRDAEFMLRDVIGVSESPFTLEQQVYDWNAQRWECSLSLPPMTRAQAEPWLAFFLKLRGRKGTFLLGNPDGATPRGTPSGTPLVNGAHSARASSLSIKGWTASAANVLKTGDMIQLGSGSTARLHKVLSDVSANGSGIATVDIMPALRTSYSDGAAIVTSSAVGLFRLTKEVGWSTDAVSLFGISFAAVEALG